MRTIAFLFIVVILGSCGGKSSTDNSSEQSDIDKPTTYPEGETVYMSSCVACHQKNGAGVPGAFPPLANSDYLMDDIDRAIEIAANGMEGEITVNGQKYNQLMAPQGLSNQEVRDVMNYILNSWGNEGGEVSMADVARVLGE